MKVDLTPEEIEACIDALCEVPRSDQATRDALGKLQLAQVANEEEEFAALTKRVDNLEIRLEELRDKIWPV